MWPWGHLAFGYLCYAGYLKLRHGRSPHGWTVLFLAVGTQFPDLVDKPMAYWFDRLPEGRSLAHSLVVLVPLGLLAVRVAALYDRVTAGEAFALGNLSHVAGDALSTVATSDVSRLTFLAWPFLPAPEHTEGSFLDHARTFIGEVTRLSAGGLS